MIYIFVQADRENNRSYVDLPRSLRDARIALRQVYNLPKENGEFGSVHDVDKGLFFIEGAKSPDEPAVTELLRTVSETNPGKKVMVLSTTAIGQCPPSAVVIQSVTKSGVLPV
jgi:hypothetical protein